METLYSQFQIAIETANSTHEFCVFLSSPSLSEMIPNLNHTHSDVGYSHGLLEQYTACYRKYTKDALTLMCEKEKQLKDVIRSFEDESQSGDNLELMKEQLDFIVSARLAQVEKGSEITVAAYENDVQAQTLHGSDKAAINREKLFNLRYSFNSCDKILEK